MKRWYQRLTRGYSDADMELFRMKVSAGLDPGDANLDLYQRAALCAIDTDELVQIASHNHYQSKRELYLDITKGA